MRPRICYWILLLLPFAVYFPGILREYGLREDYHYLIQARYEPGTIAKEISAQGRPLYGALLETSFARIDTVTGLMFLRLFAVSLLSLLGVIIWRHLDTNGWPQLDALGVAAAIMLLPAAQVSVGWAIGWPWICAAILSVAGFMAVETELAKGGLKRSMGIVGGVAIYMLATLIYQPNTMFAVVLIAATMLPRIRTRTRKELLRWFFWHISLLFGALALTFVFVKFLQAGGGDQMESRMVFETAPFSKLWWVISQMLPNALGLFALRCDFHSIPSSIFFWLTVAGVVAFLSWIAPGEEEGEGGAERTKWWLCLAVLPCIAMLISIVAAERVTGYRTHLAISGLIVVLVFACLRRLPVDREVLPRLQYGFMGLILLVAAIMAGWNTSELIAKPQAREWLIVKEAVTKARFTDLTRFYLLVGGIDNRSTDLVHADEYGSLSTVNPDAAASMFRLALLKRYPKGVPKGYKYTFQQGTAEPAEGTYDVLIDLRQLQRWRE